MELLRDRIKSNLTVFFKSKMNRGSILYEYGFLIKDALLNVNVIVVVYKKIIVCMKALLISLSPTHTCLIEIRNLIQKSKGIGPPFLSVLFPLGCAHLATT